MDFWQDFWRNCRALRTKPKKSGFDYRRREVHQIIEIEWREATEELKNLKYTGGGGTDFRPLIKAAAEFSPDVLIYLTDLFGETGDEPDFPVIWATHGVSGKANWGEQIKLK